MGLVVTWRNCLVSKEISYTNTCFFFSSGFVCWFKIGIASCINVYYKQCMQRSLFLNFQYHKKNKKITAVK